MKANKWSGAVAGIPTGRLGPIPKTKFLEVLEDIHKNTDMRYGQIVYNSLRKKRFARSPDTFSVMDEELTFAVMEYRERLKKNGLWASRVNPHQGQWKARKLRGRLAKAYPRTPDGS